MASGDEVIRAASQSGHINLNLTIFPTTSSAVQGLTLVLTHAVCNRHATMISFIFNKLIILFDYFYGDKFQGV
jgi:hypothetical protein